MIKLGAGVKSYFVDNEIASLKPFSIYATFKRVKPFVPQSTLLCIKQLLSPTSLWLLQPSLG